MKNIPAKILKYLDNAVPDSIGLSGANVFVGEKYVVKIQPDSAVSQNEKRCLEFLKGKVLVPQVVEYCVQDQTAVLVMTKLKGKMLCDEEFLQNQKLLLEKAAECLCALWNVPVDCCEDLDLKLQRAEYNVEHNLVDMNNVEPTTFGKQGRFANPEKLLQWLLENQPQVEPVFSHGDFCLPNILATENGVGVVDLPFGGVRDKFCDIALLFRSARSNLAGHYNGKFFAELNQKLFFEVLNIVPDWEKMDYYLMLDELL